MKSPSSRVARLVRVALALIAVAVWMVFGGFGEYVRLGYAPFVGDLDGLSELSITTYPAWYPSEAVHIPFFYKRRVSPDSVYFQVFVRDAERKSGANPHVDSVRIHSLAYSVGGGPSTVLISDYDRNFWMQDQPEYAQPGLDLSAVRYHPDAYVTVEISLTLNGRDYTHRGRMEATERSSYYPLFIDWFR